MFPNQTNDAFYAGKNEYEAESFKCDGIYQAL